MNENTPMTPAQQLFAEAHHNLVYAFLNEKKLPEDEYYDVVAKLKRLDSPCVV